MKNPTLNFLQSLILLSILLITAPVFSQLSGTYTLGDENSDFATFSDAVNSIKQQGLNGDIEFLVKPGVYNNVNVINIENPTEFIINFSYDGTENDSALIIKRLKVSNSDFVSFIGFSLYTEENQDNSLVIIEGSDYSKLENCKVFDLYDIYYGSTEGLVYIRPVTSGQIFAHADIFIINCTFYSPEENTIIIVGYKGAVHFENCIIHGHVEGSCNTVYKNCLFYLNDIWVELSAKHFENNKFYSDLGHHKFRGSFTNNEFFMWCTIQVDDYLKSNTFYYDFDLNKWSDNAEIIQNTFYGEFVSGSNGGLKITQNIFYDWIYFPGAQSIFASNIIYDTMRIAHGINQIYNNNFAQSAIITSQFAQGRIKNNNIGNLNLGYPGNWEIENNNFINQGNGIVNDYGENAHFNNPLYTNDSCLYANNPCLIGKGTETYYKYDIDSILQKEPCTIGANEICFDWQMNEIDLICSDSLQLDLCIDTLENMYWSPAYLFDDTTSTNPIIFTEDSTTIYLHQSNGTILDSLIINTSVTLPIAHANYTREGLTVTFHNQTTCANSYLWHFGDGGTSTEDSPTHTYETGGSYQCTLMASNYLGNAYWAALFDLVSINENSYKNNPFVVYPNPTNNSVLVKSNNNIHSLTILNVYGQLMYSKKLKGCKQHKTDISSFPKGIYFIRVQTSGATSNTVSTKSIIKN